MQTCVAKICFLFAILVPNGLHLNQIIYSASLDGTLVNLEGIRDKFFKGKDIYRNVLRGAIYYGTVEISKYGNVKLSINQCIQYCIRNIVTVTESIFKNFTDYIESVIGEEEIVLYFKIINVFSSVDIVSSKRLLLHGILSSSYQAGCHVRHETVEPVLSYIPGQNLIYKCENFTLVSNPNGHITILAKSLDVTISLYKDILNLK